MEPVPPVLTPLWTDRTSDRIQKSGLPYHGCLAAWLRAPPPSFGASPVASVRPLVEPPPPRGRFLVLPTIHPRLSCHQEHLQRLHNTMDRNKVASLIP